MERNIMIVSTVRSDTQLREDAQQGSPARPNTDIGFAKDYRRVNVAFSRARRLLIIVGNEGHFADNHEIYGEIRKIVGRYGQRLDIKAIPKIKS
jgi:superfamily I DNA and/or RNA helicase